MLFYNNISLHYVHNIMLVHLRKYHYASLEIIINIVYNKNHDKPDGSLYKMELVKRGL